MSENLEIEDNLEIVARAIGEKPSKLQPRYDRDPTVHHLVNTLAENIRWRRKLEEVW